MNFGDKVKVNGVGADNPRKEAFYVRSGSRTGRLNPGPYVELTDGKGSFWTCHPGNVRPAFNIGDYIDAHTD